MSVVVLLIAISILGTYAVLTLNNSNNNITNTTNESAAVISDTQGSVSNNGASASWHKVDTRSGVGSSGFTFTTSKSKAKVVSSAMPIKNYATNSMFTTVSKNGYSVGSSELYWNSTNAVATKSKTIEFSGAGTYSISISAYELQYWNLEVYEYY
ncbi:MAG: hypothetical protein ACRC1M_07955 [Methanobacteriaceae archaeon]